MYLDEFAVEANKTELLRERDEAMNPRLAPLRRLLESIFKRQLTLFLARLQGIEEEFAVESALEEGVSIEAVSEDDWGDFWDEVTNLTRSDWEEALEPEHRALFEAGGENEFGRLREQAVDALGTTSRYAGLTFNIANERAVNYLRNELDRQIARINDVTRAAVNMVIRDAVSEGDSYSQVAARLRDLFDGFVTDKDENGRDRADRIAIFETGDKYEGGNREAAKQMRDELRGVGTVMKIWITVGDGKVRDKHKANEGASPIGLEEDWPSGTGEAPTDPGCRCTVSYDVVVG